MNLEFTKEEIQSWVDTALSITLESKEERELKFRYYKEVGLITWESKEYANAHYEKWKQNNEL